MTDLKPVPRDKYIELVSEFIGNGSVKIFTGIRRSGKSTIMELVSEMISDRGKNIHVDLDLLSNDWLLDRFKLYEHIKENMAADGTNVFLDEVQNVPAWETVIRSLITEGGSDIYITGSNSSLLSSEYSTKIAGRYNEIHVRPLSLRECRLFNEKYGVCAEDAVFDRYVKYGGFPQVWKTPMSARGAHAAIYDIYKSIVAKDLAERYGDDFETIDRTMRFVCDNICSVTSLNRMYNHLSGEMRGLNKERFYAVAGHLEEAYVIERVRFLDLAGNRLLKPRYKFYVTDLGIKHALMGYRDRDVGKHLENIVFLELRNRGYQVFAGDFKGKEVDFVAKRGDETVYVQCAARITEGNFEREFGNLGAIRDSYPKFVVTDDGHWADGNVNGIRYLKAEKFLTSDLF
ncbi:MAG: ATP-binding protein [Thermoplasmatales archaeon]|nr:ATP-binding protein [Thermoplasmatales archaeon]